MTDGRRGAAALLTAVALAASACSVGADSGARREPPGTQATSGSATDGANSSTEEAGSDTAIESEIDAGAGTGEPPVSPVEWSDCGGGLECASVPVPVDYGAPEGALIDIALVRVPADGGAIGSLFVNPGGPGASGIEFVRDGFRLDRQTASRYHLVGFDPRGIGESDPLTCSVARDESPMPDLSPDTDEELRELDDFAVEVVEDCAVSDGALLPHLTTTNVARDLDRLRQAVGDGALHYYGLSYGTLLAVRYGQLFADSVGHLVLDGVVDPGADLTDLLRQQAIAFETGFERLDDRCDELRCPADGLTVTFDRVMARLEADGPVGDVGPSELVMASLLPSYAPSILPAYATALAQADANDFTAIERLSDFFVGSVSFTAYAAFACADGRPPSGSESWDRFADELEVAAPRFGAAVANELRVCAHWPPPADDPIDEPTASSLSGVQVPILVVGNTGDAATPLVNAERVAGLLPEARLVVVDSARHTAYNGSSCVRDLVADYLAGQRLPDVSRCGAD